MAGSGYGQTVNGKDTVTKIKKLKIQEWIVIRDSSLGTE